MLSDASVLASVPLALPSLWALSFVVPLGLQALLLHPRFSDAVSRPLRFLLLFPAVYLAYRAPYTYRIEPHEQAIGFNFRMGIFGPNFVLLSLTWGLARDRSHYAWLGFLDEKKMEGMGKEESNVGAKATGRRGKAKNGFMQVADAQAGAASAAAQEAEVKTIVAGRYDSPYQIAMSTIHLLTSMRGVGYAFGPPVHALKYSAPARKTNTQFFKAALSSLIVAHVASTLCLIVIVTPQEQRVAILQSFVPRYIPASALENFCLFASYIAVGLSLHANMNIGFESTSLVALVLNLTLRAVAPTHYRPERFNSLEYPTLFDRPYWPSEGVGSFWRSRWHGLFAVFSVFYWQVLSIFGWAFGKDVGKIAGVAVVFGLSAWLHHDAFESARYGMAPLSLPFLTRYGGTLFFAAQAFAVIAEGYFTRLTGRKVRGIWALLWSYTIIIGFGCWAARSWLALGLVEGLPTVDRWGWGRFLVPNLALLPPPLCTL